jgi:hypothetical protein
MAYKMYAAFIASLSIALTLASNETFGGSWAGQERNVPALGLAAGSSTDQGLENQSISGDIHYRYTDAPLWDAVHQYPSVISVAGQERNVPTLGPAAGGFFYGPGNRQQSISGDIHYRYTYEPLWDAVHQYPSVISPSETVSEPVVRAIVPGCSVQTVTGPDSKESISIVRC